MKIILYFTDKPGFLLNEKLFKFEQKVQVLGGFIQKNYSLNEHT